MEALGVGGNDLRDHDARALFAEFARKRAAPTNEVLANCAADPAFLAPLMKSLVVL